MVCDWDFCFFLQKKMDVRVILSMTTIPSRVVRLPRIVNSLLTQTYPFEQLILYVPAVCKRQQKAYVIPQELCALQSPRFAIRFGVEDDGPATKIIPAMREFASEQNVIIVSVDDDVLLESHAIEELVCAHKHNTSCLLGFMGVVAPRFLHSEQLDNASINMTLLGGYRSVLYPNRVFSWFLETFDHIKQSLVDNEWPLPIVDDDYLFARIAHQCNVDRMVIKPSLAPQRAQLNIDFDHNVDGVSGPQASSLIPISRKATDHCFRPLDVRILHLVACPIKQTNKCAQYQCKAPDGVVTKFVQNSACETNMDNMRYYLQLLTQQNIQVAWPTRRPRVDHFDFVLISHASTIVDVWSVLRFAQSIAQYHTNASIWNLCTFHVNTHHPQLFAMAAVKQNPHTCVSLFPTLAKSSVLKSILCVQATDTLTDYMSLRCGSKIANVFYGPKNITSDVILFCNHGIDNSWQCDGSNAQMDALFGDPSPGIAKQMRIETTYGQFIQHNADYRFVYNNSSLTVY